MNTFTQMAIEADTLLQAEKDKLQKQAELQAEKASLLATKEREIEEKQAALTLREKEIQLKDEEATRKMAVIRKDEDAERDLREAVEQRKASQEELKRAEEARTRAQRDIEELRKRELALSEREKTYRSDIETQVMRQIMRGVSF